MNFGEQAEILGLDEDELLELVDLFVETTLSDLAKFEAGVSDMAAEQAADAAHSIKGAAANLGFPDIHELAKNIEMNARQEIFEGSLEAARSIREKLAVIAQTVKERKRLS